MCKKDTCEREYEMCGLNFVMGIVDIDNVICFTCITWISVDFASQVGILVVSHEIFL